MFVLGVDPGLSRCGFGAVLEERGDQRAVAAGVITTDPRLPLPERLAELRAQLGALLDELKPEVVAVERVFFQTNAKTAMSVGQASGVALLTAAERGCPVVEYTSNEVKQAVTGYGSADKAQVQGTARTRQPSRAARRRRRAGTGYLSPSGASLRGAACRAGGCPVIGALSGVLADIDHQPDSQAVAVVDVGGVGYEVVVSGRQASALGSVGSQVSLSVHTHVREGAITLYGFPDRAERRLFDQLISAHGIGPALALSILTVLSPSALVAAVASGDLDALVAVPGVGKKTAQRLLVELAGRFDMTAGFAPAATLPAGAARTTAEVREALAALGYAPDEVRGALERLPAEGTVEELLREALSELAPRR